MPERDFIDRSSDLKSIEQGVINKFKWDWLEEKDQNGDFLYDYVRKLKAGGVCYCLICERKLTYGNRGKAHLLKHGSTAAHMKLRNLVKDNQDQTLPSQLQACANLENACLTCCAQSHHHQFCGFSKFVFIVMHERDFIDRSSDLDLETIEQGVKNKFKWHWLEEKDKNGDFLSDFMRKLKSGGVCYCLICERKVNYGNRGKSLVLEHGSTAVHKKLRNLFKDNQTLKSQLQACANLEKGESPAAPPPSLSYGAAPNIPEKELDVDPSHVSKTSLVKEMPFLFTQDEKRSTSKHCASPVTSETLTTLSDREGVNCTSNSIKRELTEDDIIIEEIYSQSTSENCASPVTSATLTTLSDSEDVNCTSNSIKREITEDDIIIKDIYSQSRSISEASCSRETFPNKRKGIAIISEQDDVKVRKRDKENDQLEDLLSRQLDDIMVQLNEHSKKNVDTIQNLAKDMILRQENREDVFTFYNLISQKVSSFSKSTQDWMENEVWKLYMEAKRRERKIEEMPATDTSSPKPLQAAPS